MRDLLKAVFKTGSGSAVNLLLGTIALKIIAAFTGPTGVGLFSLLRQINQTALVLATINGQNALVQGGAARQEPTRSEYLRVVLVIFLLGAAVTVAGLLLFAPWIARYVLQRTDAYAVTLVRAMVFPLLMSVFFAYLGGVLNVHRAIGRIALTQICASLALTLITLPVAALVRNGHDIAFVVLLMTSTGMGTLLNLFFLWRGDWLRPLFSQLRASLRRELVQHFFTFAGTTLVTGLAATLALLGIRAIIVRYLGLAMAGIFDAAWTLSMTYVMLVLASFSTYYLPTLSQAAEQPQRVALMQGTLRIALLLMIPLVVAVITLKPLVINVLYSPEFTTALVVMRWMLIGDYFKVVSWIMAMPMLAYSDMKTFFWTECGWHGFLLLGAWLAVTQFQSVEGIGISFMLLYVLYLAYTWYYAASRHGFIATRGSIATWASGLGIVVLSSYQTWSATSVHWSTAVLWMCAALGVVALSLSRTERAHLTRLPATLARRVRLQQRQ